MISLQLRSVLCKDRSLQINSKHFNMMMTRYHGLLTTWLLCCIVYFYTTTAYVRHSSVLRQPPGSALHSGSIRHTKRGLQSLFMSAANSANTDMQHYDVAVLGGGPAGMSIAWLLQTQHQCNVVVIDPRAHLPRTWYPNYGEWRDEWHSLAQRLNLPELKDCTTTEWEITDCFFGQADDVDSANQRTTLPRPYIRVDRVKMQALLRKRYIEANGKFISSKIQGKRIAKNLFDHGIQHVKDGSILELANGEKIQSTVVIDATGFESNFIEKEDPMLARGSEEELTTGYQIAYGFIAHVDSMGDYNDAAMTLFDYRTSHLEHDAQWLADGIDRPTFMYVMPLGKNSDGTFRVFWEETSLVGLGKRRLSFEECKRRAYQRLQHHNIKVLSVEEEEYCYIPMGGELPDLQQRIVAFGGAANMVHPSTGYHVCRMLSASLDVAKAVSQGVHGKLRPDQIASNAYLSMWNRKNRNQRDFQAYGGDFLMNQNVKMLRGFFSAFFALEQAAWGGFLAGWPGLPGNEYHDNWDKRFAFAISLFLKMPNDVRIAMMLYAIQYSFKYGPNTLVRSLTPAFLFGRGPKENEYFTSADQGVHKTIGDLDAKEEAKRMMKDFVPTAVHPSVNPTVESKEVQEEFVYPSPFNN